MPNTTQETASFNAYKPERNDILTIADPDSLKMALNEMFHSYVWQCVGRSEEQHETICLIYFGMIQMIDNLPKD